MSMQDDIARLAELTGLPLTDQTWPLQRFRKTLTKEDQETDLDFDEAIMTVSIDDGSKPCVMLNLSENIDPEDKTPRMHGGPAFQITATILVMDGKTEAWLDRNGNMDAPDISTPIEPNSLFERIKEMGLKPVPNRKDIAVKKLSDAQPQP